MSTAGHFLTMLGVFAFYATLFEAHMEKKLGIFFQNIIGRFNKRAFYYLYKAAYYQVLKKAFASIPSWYCRREYK